MQYCCVRIAVSNRELQNVLKLKYTYQGTICILNEGNLQHQLDSTLAGSTSSLSGCGDENGILDPVRNQISPAPALTHILQRVSCPGARNSVSLSLCLTQHTYTCTDTLLYMTRKRDICFSRLHANCNCTETEGILRNIFGSKWS